MDEHCTPAQTDGISAVLVMNRLIISATGTKPSPCYDVSVRQSPLRIFPPAYEVVQCLQPGLMCPQVVVPYRAVGMFRGFPGETVTVYHAGGSTQVRVQVIDDPIGAQSMGETSGTGGEGGLLRFGTFMESGNPRDITLEVGRRVEATGYSQRFSFTEAFQNAVENLPPDTNPYPDKLTTVVVDAIGAEYGGLPGLHRMFVRVSTHQ